ncbi:MAG TPA: cell surface protein SprA [Candidatus Eisenbacteria bacterium]|nr:cell surface protein SprA [Candidatus Eisenbacteria bacterium]
MPIARLVRSILNRFLLGFAGPPGVRHRTPGRRARPALAALLGAALLTASSLLHAPAALASATVRAYDPSAQYLDPMAVPLPPDFPRNWRIPVPPPLSDPGSSQVQVSLDPASGRISERYRAGNVEVRPPLVTDYLDYDELLSDRTYRKIWRERTKTTRSVNKEGLRKGGIFKFELPVQLPKTVRSIVGNGAPSIEVSGSERIAILGTSDWLVRTDTYADVTGERNRQGAFPSFEMKQELNVNMTGSIGDKIKVDVDQSSNVQTSLDNKVKLRYEGDDDDMIKTIELGNTNLSLQGASLRQEGLFGVKTMAKMGNFDFTVIASKQDAKTETARFTPSGEKRSVKVTDLEYIRRTYFFVSDKPIDTSNLNLKVYRADLSYFDVNGRTQGVARIDPMQPYDSLANPEMAGYWVPLTIGQDYEIIYPYVLKDAPPTVKIPVVRLFSQVGDAQLLAVAYNDGATPVGITDTSENLALGKQAGEFLLLKMLKPTIDRMKESPDGLFDTTNPWFKTLGYELRNFYDLGGRDIDRSSLTIKIRKIDYSLPTHPDAVTVGGETVPLVKMLGLDQTGKAGSENQFDPDGLIDDQFVNAETGIMFFPDLHPFDPDTTAAYAAVCAPGFGSFNCLDDLTRNRLWTDSLLVNRAVYYDKQPESGKDERYFIDAEFKSSQQGFYLGRFGILEGSEQVKVDGVPQRRDSDYRIDYESGLITFTRPPGPDQVITVDFSYAPGFGQVQRTLVGVSGGYNPASNLSFSTSLLREARGAQEQNVKLGEEPAHSTLGDFGTVLAFRPVWMTRIADRVPGITTDQPSALNIQGNFSASLPNPNTEDEAYIDDMEGNRESTTMALSRLSWFWSSVPVNNRKPLKFGSPAADSIVLPVSSLLTDHAGLEWYNPRPDAPTAAQEWDLKPVLTEAEGGDNNHQVLEMNVKPAAGETVMDSEDWAGVTQSFGTVGQDFSRVRFMEIWVNDFTAHHDSTRAVLHISVGRVSEDAYWDSKAPPNGRLDTEDKNFDGKLDLGTGENDPNFEDTGLDNKIDRDEPGYDPASNPDPSQDDYTYDVEKAPNDYSTINRYEKNGLGEANARPDTEDLNRNTILDTDNNYVEATIDLADTQYVAVDVPAQYPTSPKVKADNGWRLFRVPVSEEAFRAIGGGAGQNVQHMRLWLSNIERPMKIQIGGIELVGSRWLETAILDPDMIARDVQLDIRTRNNKDDAGIYQPPYEVKNQIGNSADQREQSLALGYTRLAEGDTVFAFKTLGAPPSALGWTQYRQIKFYVHGEQGVQTQNLRVIARFGPDTLNYYEYSVPVRYDWQNLAIPMDVLSQLKERRASDPLADLRKVYVDSTSYAGTGEVLGVLGNPSFTNITRVTFGLAVKGAPPGAPPVYGEVWIDELRVTDVVKDSGTSSNVSIQANFADLLAVNVSVQKQDQDFFRVGQGTGQGSGLNHSALGFSTTLNLDRFLPTAAVTLPIRFSLQHATDIPKFRTGSDVTLNSGQSDLETRRLDQQSVDMSYRRSSPVRRGLTKYTLDAISGNMSYSRRAQVLPQSIDSSWAFTAGGGYDLPIGGGGIRFGKNVKLGLLPEVVTFTAGWTSSRAINFSRQIVGDSDAVELRSDVKVRLLALGTTISYIPFSSFRVTYSLTSQRDMLLHDVGPAGFNKGTEVGRTQTTQINYTPRWLSLLNPNVSLKGQYVEDARPELKLSRADSLDLKNIRNSGAASVTMNVPISRLGGRAGRVRRGPDGKTTGGGSLFMPVRTLFSKMQDIQTSFAFDRSASLTRVAGDPGRAFKSGFSEVTSEDLDRTISGSNVAMARRYTTRASTAFRPTSAITVDIRGDHSLSFSDQSFGERRTQKFQWPDLQGRWNDLHRFMHLDKSVSSMSLRSGYSKVTDEDGPSYGPVERRINTDTFGPILGWDLVFRSGVRASLASSLTRATTIDQRVYGVTRDKQTTNTDLRITKTFPAAKGIRFFFSKKRVRLPNDLNLNFTCNLTGDRQVVSRPGERAYTESDNKGLKVGSGTTYNFTRAISGGFNFEYRQNDDLKQGIKRRGITVDFNAQFSF